MVYLRICSSIFLSLTQYALRSFRRTGKRSPLPHLLDRRISVRQREPLGDRIRACSGGVLKCIHHNVISILRHESAELRFTDARPPVAARQLSAAQLRQRTILTYVGASTFCSAFAIVIFPVLDVPFRIMIFPLLICIPLSLFLYKVIS